MKPISDKKIKPLKKVKALKKQKEDAAQSVKPAIRIQELKNKLIILGHELFATKKINESLYRKLQLITYSRTTEQKLKDSYKTLKDIDNNIKQSETSQDKQKGAPKPKKITIKAFTENKKIVDEDRLASAGFSCSGLGTFGWTSVGRWRTRMSRLGSVTGRGSSTAPAAISRTDIPLPPVAFGTKGRLGYRPGGCAQVLTQCNRKERKASRSAGWTSVARG